MSLAIITAEELGSEEIGKYLKGKVCATLLGSWRLQENGQELLVAGVFRKSLLGPVELWIELPEGAKTMRLLRGLRPFVVRLLEMYPQLIARTDERGGKLAAWVGLRYVCDEVWSDGSRWKRYET